MMTYAEALDQGYRLRDTTLQRGYTSRRVDPMSQPVLVAGGNRKGHPYVELPNYRSTTYGTIRQYLAPPTA